MYAYSSFQVLGVCTPPVVLECLTALKMTNLPVLKKNGLEVRRIETALVTISYSQV